MSENKEVAIEKLQDQLEDVINESTYYESKVYALEAEVLRLEAANQACFYAGRKSVGDASPLRAWLKYKNEVGL